MRIFAGSVGAPVGKGGKSASVTGKGQGVYTLEWDSQGLRVVATAPCENSGIVCLSPDGRFLYAANETRDFAGLRGSGGGVTAFRVDPATGELQKINDSISYGSRPSYVTTTADGRYLLVSNHGSHSAVVCGYERDESGWRLRRRFDDTSVALFSIREDGGVGGLLDLCVFEGHGYWCHGGGQSTGHVHCVKVVGDLVLAANRGADCIEVLRIDRGAGRLVRVSRHLTAPALAPRHIAVHPSGRGFFVVNENYPCITSFALDPASGEMEEVGTCGTMPAGYMEQHPIPRFTRREAAPDEANTCALFNRGLAAPADVHVSSDGEHVYASCRVMGGAGVISTFAVEKDLGVSLVSVTELPGGDPRGFSLVGDDHLIVGLMDSGIVRVYRLEDGIPTEVEAEAEVPSTASFAPLGC